MWAGLASISAVVKDNVSINRSKVYNLYPNIYVMLHADSGLKKGPPIAAAKRLVNKVGNTTVISGRSSIQGILKEMGSSKTEPGGKIKTSNSVFIASSELTSSIVTDPIATTILTDLYDRHYNVDNWKSLLKLETFSIKAPTVTMFTATNEAHSSDFFASKDIQGGYIARTFVIHESKRNKINSLTWELDHEPNLDKSAEYLIELSKLNGQFQPFSSRERCEVYHTGISVDVNKVRYFNDTGVVYENWYREFMLSIDDSEVKDNTGTLNRFGDSVLKVAMLLSLADSTDLIISAKHMSNAIAICETLVGNVRKATLGKIKKGADNTDRKTIAIEELMKSPNHEITKVQFMKKYWMHGNVNEWDEAFLSLESAGMISIGVVGNQVIYVMPESHYQQMKAFLEGKTR